MHAYLSVGEIHTLLDIIIADFSWRSASFYSSWFYTWFKTR